jgi:hypothetical protein
MAEMVEVAVPRFGLADRSLTRVGVVGEIQSGLDGPYKNKISA